MPGQNILKNDEGVKREGIDKIPRRRESSRRGVKTAKKFFGQLESGGGL